MLMRGVSMSSTNLRRAFAKSRTQTRGRRRQTVELRLEILEDRTVPSLFPSVLPLSTLNGGNGYALNGIANNDSSGTSVDSAGDVNGDGNDDLIIGPREASAGGSA